MGDHLHAGRRLVSGGALMAGFVSSQKSFFSARCGIPCPEGALRSATSVLFSLLLMPLLLGFNAAKGACTEESSVCVDGPGSKFINGVEVWRECWNYQITKTCSEEETLDYCQGLAASPFCKPAAESCTSLAPDGSCLAKEKDYRCSAPYEGAPSEVEGITLLDDTHTVTESPQNAACRSFLENPACYIASEKCLEGPEMRTVNGVAVFKECWKKEVAFACADAGVSNSCALLEAAGCTPASEALCIRTDEEGRCLQYERRYHCVNTAPPEAEGIAPSGPPTSGFDLFACEEAAKNLTCKAPKSVCSKTDATGACIEKTYSYSCIKNVKDNRCEPLEAVKTCTTQKSVCIERDGFKCLAYRKEILCKSNTEIEAPGADILNKDILITEIGKSDTCAPIAENPACAPLKTVCTEGPAEKIVNGVPVYKECWKYEHTYVCSGGAAGPPGSPGSVSSSDCSALEGNKECTKVSSECIAKAPDGSCATYAHTYECTESEGGELSETVCRPAECLEGLCSSIDPSDSDFSRMTAVMEAARQGAVYADTDGGTFFNGEDNRCTKKVLGFSCCDEKVRAAASNSSAFGKVLSFGAGAASEAVKYVGSPYVYDVLSASESTSGMLNFLYGNASSGVYNPSLSFYGFGMTLQGGTMYFTFNPTMFAAAVAVQIALDYLQCEPAEQALMLKKGQRLCHYVGTYCSKSAGLSCVERTESYCCYNSPLARIIQEEGREQLSRGWGSAKTPMCQGFTQSEFESLNFDAMDLSEFEALIAQKSELNVGAAQGRGESNVKGQMSAPENQGGFLAPAKGTPSVSDPSFTGGQGRPSG